MSRKFSQEQIDKARQTIRPLIPLAMVCILEVVNLARRGETWSQSLEDSLVILGTKIAESDDF
jgi:hypothetical protein